MNSRNKTPDASLFSDAERLAWMAQHPVGALTAIKAWERQASKDTPEENPIISLRAAIDELKEQYEIAASEKLHLRMSNLIEIYKLAVELKTKGLVEEEKCAPLIVLGHPWSLRVSVETEGGHRVIFSFFPGDRVQYSRCDLILTHKGTFFKDKQEPVPEEDRLHPEPVLPDAQTLLLLVWAHLRNLQYVKTYGKLPQQP